MRGYSIAAAWLNRCTSTARLLSEASSKMIRSFAESSPICQKGRRVGQAVGTGREVGGRGAGVNLPTTALQRCPRHVQHLLRNLPHYLPHDLLHNLGHPPAYANLAAAKPCSRSSKRPHRTASSPHPAPCTANSAS